MVGTNDIGGSEFKVINCMTEVTCSADETWAVVGSYADAGQFLDVSSKLVEGDGGLGSIRLIGESILEVMVGKSLHSYSYAQTRGPMAAFAYHGCVSVEEIGPERSRLTYTLIYDQAKMSKETRNSEAARISARFSGAAANMKRHTEAKL